MPYYAEFQSHAGLDFRLDTRIYLRDGGRPGDKDKCVGAIIAKSPGPASSQTFGKLVELRPDDDNLLPSVRNRFLAAYGIAGKPIPEGAYVRVWNLFYLCGPKLSEAIRRHKGIPLPLICPSESNVPPIVWFAWGNSDPYLDPLKSRFLKMKLPCAFFLDKYTSQLVPGLPTVSEFAKHPQGMEAPDIVVFLSHHV